MPLIKTHISSESANEKTKNKTAKELSAIVSEILGKPESFVCSLIVEASPLTFDGEIVDGAFIELKSIGGLTPEVNKQLSEKICKCLSKNFALDNSKIYINFFNVQRSDWGWKGSTFA